jgi:hypothetical protein
VFPSRKGKKGFQGKRKSYVDSHPTHLLSGALKCGACGGAIALVSGKGSGYYGCLNASRHACENKVLIGRKRLEDKFMATLNAEVLKPEVLDAVYQRVSKKVKKQFAHVPEELRLKRIELNRAETRVHNFVEFIASGRATPALADALAQAEQQVKELTAAARTLRTADRAVSAGVEAADWSGHADPREAGCGAALFPGALFFRELEPARCGGWCEFIAMVEAPGIEPAKPLATPGEMREQGSRL